MDRRNPPGTISRTFSATERVVTRDVKNHRFQIDGNTTGINATNFENSLNETDTIKTDVVFENLFVAGDIVLRGAIDAKTWSDLDDLLLKTEGNARITGNKRFTSGVTLRSTVNCSRINGHKLSEFVNLDADQEFPRE